MEAGEDGTNERRKLVPKFYLHLELLYICTTQCTCSSYTITPEKPFKKKKHEERSMMLFTNPENVNKIQMMHVKLSILVS
jgi:hypothetical protein